MQQRVEVLDTYECQVTDGTGTAGRHLTAWFAAWASLQGLSLAPGTLNLCAVCDVTPPAAFISLRPWDGELHLEGRKRQTGYDPRLYPVLLRGSQGAWLFRWSDVEHLAGFVADGPSCSRLRRCEVIAELNLTRLWDLQPGSKVTLRFA
jgi:hypothetical protein